MDRPLRLISANPLDALARTVEALLVVASQPLTVDELAEATVDDVERIETALGLLRERYSEDRSGIVLQHVAGGYAFGAAREAAEACSRLFERPVERGLSQAALETLAIIAYLGPVSRPEIAQIRGVAADSAVASLVERGLIAEAGRENSPGAPCAIASPRCSSGSSGSNRSQRSRDSTTSARTRRRSASGCSRLPRHEPRSCDARALVHPPAAEMSRFAASALSSPLPTQRPWSEPEGRKDADGRTCS